MKLRLGLIGCGIWGRNILRDLCDLDTEVIVVDTAATQRAFAAANGASQVVPTTSDLPEVDGIIVATPATTHAALLDELLDRQTPIFTEKPFTTDAKSAKQLAEKAPDRIFVMHVWRYHRGIEMLRDIAQSGELGAVQMLRSTRTNWSSPRRDTDSTWTLLPHDLSIAAEILGFIPEPKCAHVETLDGRPVGLIALMGNGPAAVVEVSNRYAEKRREVRLHCERGVAVLPAGEASFVEVACAPESTGASRPAVERRPINNEPPLRRELKSFVEYLRGGDAPKSSAAEGLAVVETITQLRRLAGISQ